MGRCPGCYEEAEEGGVTLVVGVGEMRDIFLVEKFLWPSLRYVRAWSAQPSSYS